MCLLCVCLLGAMAPLAAQIPMPDPRQMAGIPRPVDDLPDRSISVRLIRGQLSNNITGHPVELRLDGGRVLTATTDGAGRAQFDNLRAGARARAVATVDGERLESQSFDVPPSGGVRLLLVATDTSATPSGGKALPAVRPGEVVLGDGSRILIEPGDEGLRVFYLFDVVNVGTSPVEGKGPLEIAVPAGARGLTILPESSTQATASGDHISVTGPFPSGSTAVHAVFEVPVRTGSIELSQALPVPATTFVVIVQKVAGLDLVSEQLSERREMTTPEGQTYIIARGPSLRAGEPLRFALTGLPHHSRWPVAVALGLAGLVIVAGVWLAWSRVRTADTARRDALFARREQLLGTLVALERERRDGFVDGERFGARRSELVRSLERVYGELDSGPGNLVREEGPPR